MECYNKHIFSIFIYNNIQTSLFFVPFWCGFQTPICHSFLFMEILKLLHHFLCRVSGCCQIMILVNFLQ